MSAPARLGHEHTDRVPASEATSELGRQLLNRALQAVGGDRDRALEALSAAIERLQDEGVRRRPRAVPSPAPARRRPAEPDRAHSDGGLAALALANFRSLYDYRLPATGKALGDAVREEVAEASRFCHAAYQQARVNSRWFGLIASQLDAGATVRQALTVDQLQQLQYRARADE